MAGRDSAARVDTPRPVDVVFDGRCGFCTRTVGWVRRLDRRGIVRTHAYQIPGVPERFGLSPDQAAEQVWAIRAGRRLGGAAAVGALLDVTLGTGLFGALRRLPGMGRAQDAAYRWVADHRRFLPGVTPWCATHPGRCAPAPCDVGP